MEGPLVTIVVPSWNKEHFIGDTIASVRAQTYPHWELLVVDDASTDGTADVVERHATEESRITLERLASNAGANRCRNRGIERARGEYLIFLDADDILASTCLEERVKAMADGDLDFAVFTMEVFRTRLGDDGQRWEPDASDPLGHFLRHRLPWSILQPIWRTALLRVLRGFDETFTRHQDVDLHTRALLHPGVRFTSFTGAPDCFYRISEERKNVDVSKQMDQYTTSSVRYYFKFQPVAESMGKHHLLMGLVHRTYLQLLYNRKRGALDHAVFERLEKVLLDPRITSRLAAWKRGMLRVSRAYNLSPVRIPGVNRLVDSLITL